MGFGSRVAGAVEAKISSAFGKVGWCVAGRPWTCIGLCLLLGIALSAGVMFIESETNADYLYTPLGNRGANDLEVFEELFAHAPNSFTNQIIIYTKDQRNLFTVEVLNSVYALVQSLREIVHKDGDTTLSWQDVCVKAPQDASSTAPERCEFSGVTDLMTAPINDDSQLPVMGPQLTDDLHGGFAATALFAGGRTLSSGDDPRVVEATAFKIFLNLAYIQDSITDTSEEVDAYSRLLFEFLAAKSKELEDDPDAPYELVYSFDWSDEEELDKSTSGDVNLFMVTILMICVFSSIVTRSYTNSVLSKGNVVWGAQLGVVLAIGSAFGLMGYVGVKFNPVVSTSAFLLLGLGVDDAYVMIQGYHSAASSLTPEATVQERIALTFRTAGVSVCFTSLTDVLAFVVGATSTFPAVRAFCLYAAAGVAFDFLFQVLFFGAVLAIDCHREYCGVPGWKAFLGHGWLRNDRYSAQKNLIKDGVGPEGGKIPVMPEQALQARAMIAFGKGLLSPAWSAVVVVVFAGYVAFAVLGLLQVDTGLDIRDLAPTGSYWALFVSTNFDYFQEKGPPFDVAFPAGTVDWADAQARAQVLELVEELEGLECLFEEPRGVWLRQLYADAATYFPDQAEALPALDGDLFYEAVDVWLAGPGQMFSDDIVRSQAVDGPQRVEQTKMRVRMEALESTTGDKQGVPCMEDARKVLDKWIDEHVEEGRDPPVISYFFFQHWQSSAVIVQQTTNNLVYAAGACFVVTMFVLPHPVLCFVAMVVVASILAGLVATMSLILNIRIETISMIDLVMSIGFSIDNVAHYLHAYMISRERTSRDKAVNALERIGIPILQGDASTMLALLPLLASSSRIFQSFFYILFSVLLLGALHAIVLLPVILARFGPVPEHADDDFGSQPNLSSDEVGNVKTVSNESQERHGSEFSLPEGATTPPLGGVHGDIVMPGPSAESPPALSPTKHPVPALVSA